MHQNITQYKRVSMKDINDKVTAELKLAKQAKSNAQRQKEYRERNRDLGRIESRVNFATTVHLEDLAEFKGMTKRELLEHLLLMEHQKAMRHEAFQAFIAKKIEE